MRNQFDGTKVMQDNQFPPLGSKRTRNNYFVFDQYTQGVFYPRCCFKPCFDHN